MKDENNLTWLITKPYSTKIFNLDRQCLKTFDSYISNVNKSIEVLNGRIISCSKDEAIKIRKITINQIIQFIRVKEEIVSIVQIKEGRLESGILGLLKINFYKL